ncbi:hypothetical protein [Saccharopolyspora gregorii]|uniref:hypothetical protein n=1 Tax=Saccharopolyspora gregorii TaxID=33914 RepID=UPI0021AD1429|nr:hypothetical protein [Saccharopolyspora gregorii]
MHESEFMDRVDDLLGNLLNRLVPRSVSFLTGAARAGEHGLVLDELTAEIRGRHIPLSPEEAAELRELLYYFELPVDALDSINDRDAVLASLNVVRAK